MSDLLLDLYFWIKSLHVISVIAWMAGIFYLPRLFVYHVEGYEKRGVEAGSDMDLLFQRQERLLLKAIMTPAMYSSWFFGLLIVFTPGIVDWSSVWPWTKMIGILGMTAFHYWLAWRRIAFLEGRNELPGRTYRMMNELPTLLMIVIVCSVIVKF
ncbi:MAG: CopD family protein [Maritimibacter sp.]|jgi:protoporphyrinogen IX oxidase